MGAFRARGLAGGLFLALLLLAWAPGARGGEDGFCAACHPGGGRRDLAALAWNGPVLGERESLCPAVVQAKSELFLLEARLGRLGEVLAGRPDDRDLLGRLQGIAARYQAALLTPLTRVEDIAARLAPLREELDARVQRPFLLREAKRRQIVFWTAALGICLTVFLAAALGHRRLGRWGGKGGGGQGDARNPAWRRALGLALALVLGGPSFAMAAGPGDAAGRVVALCELAEKASPSFPDLALEFLAEAREEAVKGTEEAWPLALVARLAVPLEPELAQRALARAGERVPAAASPRRDRDLAALGLAQARYWPDRARELGGRIADPVTAAGFFAELAATGQALDDLGRAAELARSAPDWAKGSLALARVGEVAYAFSPSRGRALLAEAFARARAGRPPERGAWVAGEVAARLAGREPEEALALVEGLPAPIAYKTLAAAARRLLARDPGAGHGALVLAWRAATELPMLHERSKALSRLGRLAAAVDPALATALLAELPAKAYWLRGEAKAAMVLAWAGRDFPAALAGLDEVADPAVRLATLARLAAVRMRSDPAQGRALFGRVLGEMKVGGHRLEAALLAPAWEALAGREAVEFLEALPDAGYRARLLIQLAQALWARGEDAAANWCRFLALNALKSLDGKQTLDKVALLGDMGREWSVLRAEEARGFFRQAAEAARALDR